MDVGSHGGVAEDVRSAGIVQEQTAVLVGRQESHHDHERVAEVSREICSARS